MGAHDVSSVFERVVAPELVELVDADAVLGEIEPLMQVMRSFTARVMAGVYWFSVC